MEQTTFIVHEKNNPSFDNLARWEREALIDPLLDIIKSFYQDPINREKYLAWKSKKAGANQNPSE